MTLGELAAEGDRPPSPGVKVEPADQLATWAPLDELGAAIFGAHPPLPPLPPLPRGAAVVVDITGNDGGGRGGRGGRGVPKTCTTCKKLKKGGCACVMTKSKGK